MIKQATSDKLVYSHEKKAWFFHSQPHVRMMLRRLFNAAQAHSSEIITVSHTEGNARNIAWFLERYPHAMKSARRKAWRFSKGKAWG